MTVWSFPAVKAEALEESWRLRRELHGPRRGRPSGFDPAPILARFPKDWTADEVASHLDVSRGAVRHWRHGRRRLSEQMADRLAVRLGFHPLNIWPEWGSEERAA